MFVLKIIPNPFDKNSTLSDLEKRKELIKESLSFIALIKNIIFLIILGFVLVFYFKISTTIVAILIGTEILTMLAVGYIKIRKLGAIYSIDTRDNAKSYRKLLITNEYWELIKSIFGIVANSISVGLIFLFFPVEISNLVQNISLNLPIRAGYVKYMIFIFVVFRGFEFIMRLIRYNWIKTIKESEDFAQINRDYLLIERKLELIKFLPGMGVIIMLLFLIGMPYWIPLIFTGFMVLMVLLSIMELKRIKNIQFDNRGVEASIAQNEIENYQNERIVGAVFGIIRVESGLKNIFKPMGLSILGYGKTYFPENSLILTNYRLLMIQIPVSGGDKIIGKISYVPQNFLFNRAEIKEKGEQIIKTNSLQQVIQLTTNEILYRDIKTVILKQTKIIIEKLSGDKLEYVFMDREYVEPLKKILSFYLKDKFIAK